MGLGQGVGTVLLDGVLGSQDEEGLLQLVGVARHGDLMLLHDLQHSRLGLGGGAVDLVGQHQVGEDGAAAELALHIALLVLAHDLGARHVGGHEVGGELDAGEGEVQGLTQGADQTGLTHAGDALQQYVATCDDGDDDVIHHLVLTDQVAAELGLNALNGGVEFLYSLVQVFHIGYFLFVCISFHPWGP